MILGNPLLHYFQAYKVRLIRKVIKCQSQNHQKYQNFKYFCGQCILSLVFFIVFSRAVVKYKFLKEFHMLTRLGCYCKMLVFNSLKLEIIHYNSNRSITQIKR